MATQVDINEFHAVLKSFLDNNNTIRAQAEVRLKEYLAVSDKILLLLIETMRGSNESFIRKLACVLFKRYGCQDNFNKLWEAIKPVEQEAIKHELLELLKKEEDPKVAKQICQVVSMITNQFFAHNKKWPELESLLKELMKGDDFMAEKSFRILGDLFSGDSDRFTEDMRALQAVFDTGFQRTGGNCLVAVAQALCILITEVETSVVKSLKRYSAHLINLIEVLYNNNDEDNLREYLNLISEVAELEPKFFVKNYTQLSTILIKASAKKDYDNEKLRQIPLEALVSIIERVPLVIKKHKAHVLELCSALFDIAISIDEEVDPEWYSPKEGYNVEEDYDYNDNVNFAIHCIDRLLGSLEEEDIFPIVERIIEHSMSNPDWRYHNAALMIAGQIGEYCSEVEKVRALISILVSHISHRHPKVRSAALYAIGLLSDYMKPQFQETFGKDLIPPMVKAVEDEVPHVQSKACAALANFLEDAKSYIAIEVAPALLPKLIKAIQVGISIVKENAVDCISAIAESAEEEFEKYYNELVPFLIFCFKKFHAKEYRELRAHILQCLVITSTAVGLKSFIKFGDTIIELLLATQDSLTNTEGARDDPQRFYLLESWKGLCMLLKKEFAPYLPRMIPGVLKIAAAMPVMGIGESLNAGSLDSVLKEVSNTPDDEVDLQTSEIEEKVSAIQMLQVFASELEELYMPYVEDTTKIIEPVLNFRPNQELRKDAADTLPTLLRCLKKANIAKEMFIAAGSRYINILLVTHDKEPSTDAKIYQILALKNVYDEMEHFMSINDVKVLTEKIFQYFKDSSDRKNKVEQDSKDEKDEDEKEDEEASEGVKAMIENEEEYQKHLTYLIGSVEKFHKDEFLPLIQTLLNSIVQPYLLGNHTAQTIAIFLIDDLLEYLGVAKLGEELWKQLAVRILNYATSENHEVRQAACYGIGALAQEGGSVFGSICVQCLTTLAAAIEIKKDSTDKDSWSSARDNAIASIGKILKYQPNTVSFGEIWSKWLHYLPLKTDRDEAKIIHEFVMDTLLSNPEMAIGADGSLLKKIIRIIIAIFDKKLIKKKLYPKLAQALTKLNQYPSIATALDNIYKTELDSNDQGTLQRIVKYAQSAQ